MPQYPFMESKDPKRKLVIGSSAITLVIVLGLWYAATRGANIPPVASTGTHGTYTTTFPLTENPISEGGNWINGQTDGLDWTNVRTTPGFAFGVESGGLRPEPQRYDDSTALLTGTWGPNQTAQATVHTANQNDKIWEEVELRLRSTLSAHNATGYEIFFRCSKTEKAYTQIVRWNGPLGKFTSLNRAQGSQYGVANGDMVKATMVGNVITAYINGVQVLQATDNTYKSGRPGMGFYIEGTTGVNSDYGFTSFKATDELTTQADAAPNRSAALH
jgi:hypothetical protein